MPFIPIEKLPNELLIAIFDATRDDPFSVEYEEYKSLEVLSHVSRHWRQLVLSVSYFWADIVIKLEQPLVRLAAYLERSQKCPLSITIESCTAVSKEQTLLVLDMICKHGHRWWQFVLKPNEDTDIGLISAYLSQGLPLPAPRLTCLRLFLPFNPPILTTNFLWFKFCSGLRTLELYIARLHARPTVAEFRSLIETSPLLENLTLVGEVFALSPTDDHAVIEIRSLTCLSIGTGTAENEYLSVLLELLSTPALEALELWSLDEEGWDVFRKSISKGRTKFPLLRSLALIEVDFGKDGDEIGYWLVRAFPMLQHLTLLEDSEERSDQFNLNVFRFLHLLRELHPIPSLTPGGLLPPIWPGLHTLTVSYTRDHSLLLCMLQSRRESKRPISRLQLDPDIKSHFPAPMGESIKSLVCVEEFCKDLVYPWNTHPRHLIHKMTGKY
jgi:hypothetical protein